MSNSTHRVNVVKIGVYDVESVKNYPRALLAYEEVIVTEKIHGSNARYYFDGKQFWVGSHKKWWKDKTNIWWRVAEKNPWIEAFCRENPKYTLRGEVTPTQPGYQYGNTPEEQFFAFDVQKPDGTYENKADVFDAYSASTICKLVPVVYSGSYNAEKLKELAEGKSLVDGAKNIREGIVISSVVERTVRGLGRAQLKLKSMAFMEKEGKA
jgi:RNA ligase (TIGR02306 family)